MTTHRLGIDIGGTFTDFTIVDNDTGATRILKIPSNPTHPEEAVFDGLHTLFTQHGVAPGSIRYFIHGTTLPVNTIIQRSGLKTALLVTQGFRDILNIGRHRIPDVFNFFTDVPDPLVPRARSFEIAERCLADGTFIVRSTKPWCAMRRPDMRGRHGGRRHLLSAQLPQCRQ